MMLANSDTSTDHLAARYVFQLSYQQSMAQLFQLPQLRSGMHCVTLSSVVHLLIPAPTENFSVLLL